MTQEEQQEVWRLHGVIRAQIEALATWRKKADEDFGKIERYSDALRRIAHGNDPAQSVGDLRRIAAYALGEEIAKHLTPDRPLRYSALTHQTFRYDAEEVKG